MPKSVLVAEDDAFLRIVLSEMCRELGYSCIAAVDGQDCLTILSEHFSAISVVLMDIHMPNVSGLDAIVAIRGNPLAVYRNLPVIATTADVRWHDKRVASEYGFDGVLEKPLTLERLSAVLTSVEVKESAEN